MNHLRPRSLRSIVVLVAAMAQLLVANEFAFAGSLPLVSRSHGHGHGHGHPVTLLAHEGHVDVVLHHEGEEPAAGESLDSGRVHGDDHVLHVASGEVSAKRWQEGRLATAVLTRGHAPAAGRVPIVSAACYRAPDARLLPDGLRSTILRL